MPIRLCDVGTADTLLAPGCASDKLLSRGPREAAGVQARLRPKAHNAAIVNPISFMSGFVLHLKGDNVAVIYLDVDVVNCGNPQKYYNSATND